MSEEEVLHADEDEQEEFKPPKDGSWVPRERLNQVRDQMTALESKLDNALRTKEPEASREDLLEQVNLGEITQAKADEIWEDQITSRVAQSVKDGVTQANVKAYHDAQISAYEEAVPELLDESSPIYTKLIATYNNFLGYGQPNDGGTMLAALEATVGPLATAKNRKSGKRKVETHQEGESGAGETKIKGRQADLTDRERAYYVKAIDAGAYKDWDEVFETLKYERGK